LIFLGFTRPRHEGVLEPFGKKAATGMHLVPLALGILAIMVGIAMVAFGIPINEFGTGNTLISAGTTAIVGGFVLLGLWTAVLQLQRLLAVLEPHATAPPIGRRLGKASPEPERARHYGRAEDAGFAPSREPLLAPEEPLDREPATARESESPPHRSTWLPEEPEPRDTESSDERPLPREQGSSWELFAPRPASPARDRSFDAIWPSERTSGEGRETTQIGERSRAEERTSPHGSGSSRGSQSATILKSGVINGMAYTLYTDGSIEAELPQGTLRFGSLDELRDYLGGQP
jgi:hypothetical protein